jgi:hypothetical protein
MMTIVRHARVLAATLTIGSAVPALSTGLAEARDNDPGQTATGCIHYENGVKKACAPGSTIHPKDADGKMHIPECGSDGKWKDLGVLGKGGGSRSMTHRPSGVTHQSRPTLELWGAAMSVAMN